MSDNQSTRNRDASGKTTRRQFMKTTAAASAGLMAYASSIQFASGQVKGANDRLGVGFVGCGGRSGAHFSIVRYLRDKEKASVDFAAACDVYRPRMEQRVKQYKVPKSYRDYHDLLADKNVDIVCVATPEHHHPAVSTAALKAGKHVYCEKPVSHWTQFEQTKQLADAAAESKCAFQLGTQAMSDPVWRR